MTMSVAYIFPGQGSQAVGMGRDLAEKFPAARAVFEEVDDALGVALSRLCFAGPAAELQLTENAQPAILAASVAALRALETESAVMPPSFVAGHSLGEYTALVAAGAWSLTTAAQMVRTRGRYMQEAAPVGVGAMAAILGADVERIEESCQEAAQGEVCSVANINAPTQVVIAGHEGAVERAITLLKARGAKRALKLNVSAPFHCALMRPAQARLKIDLDAVDFADLRVPVVTNVDAQAVTDGRAAGEALVRQVSATVRWRESLELLAREGVETFVEIGPGKVLSGLVKQTLGDAVRRFNIEDPASLETAWANLK